SWKNSFAKRRNFYAPDRQGLRIRGSISLTGWHALLFILIFMQCTLYHSEVSIAFESLRELSSSPRTLFIQPLGAARGIRGRLLPDDLALACGRRQRLRRHAFGHLDH